MLSPPKPLDEIQPNLVFELLTWMGRVTLNWGGVKRSSSNFNYKVKFQSLVYQTFCVFSQMNDSKHIRRNLNSVTWVMPRGWYFGALGAQKVKIILFQTWSCGISNRRGCRAEHNASKKIILWSNKWPWGEVKRSNNIKFWLPCQF